MPVNVQAARLRPLAAVLLGFCSGAHAQSLPHRDNVETALHGRVARDTGRDRHVIRIDPTNPAVLPADGGPLADVRTLGGGPARLWSSDGGALLVRREAQAISSDQALFDTGVQGRQWLRLDAPEEATRAIVHMRSDGTHGGEDPWRVPLRARERTVSRTRADADDHVAPFLDGAPLRFNARGRPTLRLDVWRPQVPRLLPPDATWLRVEADGRVVFDGRAPTPPLREQAADTGGCDQVLDLAGRVQVELPADAREVIVRGEPGTWLKVLAPLPGTPDEALRITTDPGLQRIVQREGEPLDAAFNRSLSRVPSSGSDVFFGRFSYFRDVAVRPRDAGVLETRSWRARFPDREQRANAATNSPRDAQPTVDATTFHWLPAGKSWYLDVPGEAGPAHLRIPVAHDGTTGSKRLRLLQAGRRAQDLMLDPRIVDALATASSPADPLLVADPSGAPVVDASQAQLLVEDAREPLQLENVGDDGAWVAVERRVPAHRRLADGALAASALPTDRLRRALLQEPSSDARDQFDDPSATRAITSARNLLRARSAAFAKDDCIAVDSDAVLQQSLATFRAAIPSDPVLARCAAIRAATSAAERGEAIDALREWSTTADRFDVLTGFLASSLLQPGNMDDAGLWRRLAASLDAEGEFPAAALARRASGVAPDQPVDRDELEAGALPAARSAGDVRLKTTRQSEVAYALTGTAGARWVFPEAGGYRVELRSFAGGNAPRWVELRSGGRTWRTALPAVDASRTELRDIVGGAAPGAAVTIDFHVAAAGVSLDVAGDGAIARVEPRRRLRITEPRAIDASRPRTLRARLAERCELRDARVELPIGEPRAPEPVAEDGRPIQPAGDSPVLPVSGAIPDQPAALALDALWRSERGDADAAVSAARAIHLREREPFAAPVLFGMLDDRITWENVDPVSSGGRRLRALADGHPTSPTGVLRQRLAGVSAERAFVVLPGQAWVLEGLQPRQRVRLVFELRAALPADGVELRLTGGERHVLRDGAKWASEDVADADGSIRLNVGPGLPGSFIALAVLDTRGVAFDPTHGVAYHRAPVRVRMDRPGLLRIAEWSGRQSTVRTQWVPAGVVSLAPQHIPGAALRVGRMVMRKRALPEASTPQPAPAMPQPAALETPAQEVTPAAAQASSWPREWPNSGGEDGTWGLNAARRQRIDNDDPDSDVERFSELAWRWRYRVGGRPLWGRADVTLRRPDVGSSVLGAEHLLEWRQDEGPWGATLRTSAWTQKIGAPHSRRATALEARAALQWEVRRDDRWRDRLEFGVTARDFSLRGLDRNATAGIDNDVYSRYRDAHRRQVDAAYSLAWRARYDTEFVASTRAVARVADPADIDNAGVALGMRWARHGWMASTSLDARRYFAGHDRDRAFDRRRVEADVSRFVFDNDDGWRIRLQLGRDLSGRGIYGGVSFEWFDHDGRGFRDFAPSELFLRGVTESDVIDPLIPSALAP